eukprot:244021_1
MTAVTWWLFMVFCINYLPIKGQQFTCNYFTAAIYSVDQSNQLLPTVNIINGTIAMWLDIQTNDYYNFSQCNILCIGDTNTEFPLISINRETNYIELTLQYGSSYTTNTRSTSFNHVHHADFLVIDSVFSTLYGIKH